MSPIPTGAGRVAGRALRAGLTALSVVLLSTCTDNPVAPGRPGIATLRLTPTFDASARLVPLTLDNVRITVIRPPSTTVATVNRAFDPNNTQLNVSVNLVLQSTTEDLIVILELYSGTTLLFSGTDTITVTAGVGAAPASVPVTYQGPGSQIDSLIITPRDTTVLLGGSFSFGASGLDAQQAPVPDFYVSWNASAGTLNAAGVFTAPLQRGTVIIRATAPNTGSGARDSTNVFVVAGPGALTLFGGNGQSALAGARLPQPLEARVTGTDGLALAGVQVGFAATTGGGSVDSITTTTDANGVARMGATLGTTIGQQTFTASTAGLPNLVFTANATNPGGNVTWLGTTSSDWSNAANWSPAAVPSNTSDVLIPSGTPNGPQITTSCSAQTLTVNSGATLNLGAFNCAVEGNVFADGTITGTGALTIGVTAQIRGNFPSLILSGPVTAVGAINATGNLTLTGPTSTFTLNGQSADIGGNLQTQSSALLIMTNPSDAVTVAGNASFAGGNEFGQMSAGTLGIGGNFTQVGTVLTPSADSYHPSGTHQTVFTGNSPSISFQTPGDVPGSSHFQGLAWTSTGTMTLASDVYSHGTFTTSSAPVTVSSTAGRLLQVGSHSGAGATTFNNVRLILNEPAGGPLTLNNATFQGLASTATQLTVNHPGTGGPFTFDFLTFSVTPTGGGLYLSATDLDGGSPLTINITNSSPSSGAPFVAQLNGAVVNWPPTAPAPNWTGAVDGNWQNPANWANNQVPTSADDVSIPSGTPFSPALTANAAVRSLTVNSGAGLDLGTFNLQASGNVFANSPIAGSGGAVQILATAQITGTFPNLTVQAAVAATGGVNVLGNLTITGAGANYIAGATSTTVTGNLTTQSGGTLTMNSPSDVVVVIGNASFGGGTSTLTAGVIQVQGDFTQTGSTTYPAGGGHTTQFSYSGTGPFPTVTFADPVNSRFQNLDVTTVATVLIASNVTVLGQLSSVPSGTPGTLQGTTAGLTLTAGTAIVTGLVLDNLPLVVSGPGPVAAFSGVTFINQNPSGTQLRVNSNGAATPFAFDNLQFVTPPTTGGFYLVASDLDGAASGVLTIDVTNSTPAAASRTFVQELNGALIRWPPAVGRTWNGATSANWSDPANWTPAGVPTAADDVNVPGGTPFLPVLSQAGAVAALSGSAGANLDLAGFVLSVNGDVNWQGSMSPVSAGSFLQLQGPVQFLQGNLSRALVLGSYTLVGATSLNGDLEVGTGGTVFVNGNTLAIAGGLSLSGLGTFQMTDPADLVSVQGNASFDGGNLSAGFLTAGALIVGGNFTQLATNSGDSFHPAGTHVTFLSGLSPTVSFATPGDVPGTSHFQEAQWAGGGTLTLGSDVYAHGAFTTSSQTASTIASSAGRLLSVGSFFAGSTTTISNVRLAINAPTGGPLGLDNIVFQGLPTTATQLTVTHNGAGGPFVFANLTFVTTPTTGGLYLNAIDADGAASGVLTINVIGASPASGAPFFTGTNGAVVNWPPVAGNFTWTGAVSSDWSVAGNWNPAQVPGPIDNVTLVPITNQPMLTTNVGVNNLTSTTGSILDLDGFVLAAGGSVDVAGSITGTGTAGVTLSGNGQTLLGTINAELAVLGSYTLNGNLITNANLSVQGLFDVGAFTAQVGGNFVTLNNGVLVMTTPGGFLDVGLDAIFAGGSTAGRLTAGTLQIAGAFDQIGVNSAQSFAADPGHLTVLSANPASITFTTPGANGSHFGDLSEAGFGATINLNSDVTVLGFLSGGDGFGGTFVGITCPAVLTLRSYSTSGPLTLDCVRLVLDDPAGTNTFLNGISFTNLPTDVTQLTILHPGVAAGNLSLDFLTFVTLTTGDTGFYIEAVDTDGTAVNLTVAPTGTNVTNGPSFQVAVPPVTILWP